MSRLRYLATTLPLNNDLHRIFQRHVLTRGIHRLPTARRTAVQHSMCNHFLGNHGNEAQVSHRVNVPIQNYRFTPRDSVKVRPG